MAQQNVIATRLQAQTDLEARQMAAHEASTRVKIEKTANPKNWLELFPK
jgi:hypothetical protein